MGVDSERGEWLAHQYEFEETLEVSGSNSEDYEDFKEEFEQLCQKYGYRTTI